MTSCSRFCGLSTISYCVTSGCRYICLSTICLSDAISCNNSCFTSCSFEGCRVHLHKIFIQGVCEVSFILVHCEVFTSDQLNFVVFTNFSIFLSTCLNTRCSRIFICCDFPSLTTRSICNSFQLVFCCSTTISRCTIPSRIR